MTDTPEDDAKNARLEWLLNERVGGESPPDLQHAVLARLHEPATAAHPRRGSRMLAAAMVLIGVAAVVAVSQFADNRPADNSQDGHLLNGEQSTLTNKQNPALDLVVWKDPSLVRSRQDIESLPADTLQVFAINLSDDALPALLRLHKLEALAMTVSTYERPLRGVQKPRAVYVTDDGLERLASLPNLRALVLEGQLKLKGPGIARVVMDAHLRELKLMNMAVTNDMLRGVCKAPLVSLQLHSSQTFSGGGLKAIAACQTLRFLSLTGCTHLEDLWIANLSGMKALEELYLNGVGSHTLFSGIRLNPLPEEPPGSGVTDRLLENLAPLPKLRKLDLSSGYITDKGLLALRKFPALRDVSLGNNEEISAGGIHTLPQHIERLALVGHRSVDAKMLEVLLSRPGLRDLNLAWCRGLPSDAIEQLCQATHLRSLDVSGWELSDADRERLQKLPVTVKLPKIKKN
tara:strand:- start:10739 stop:12121 length:1383 start_codon:yes stop_codon:yes gene_type:complete